MTRAWLPHVVAAWACGAACTAGVACALLWAATGCGVRSEIGNACPYGRCPAALQCAADTQQYPDGCFQDEAMCHNAVVPPDQLACELCDVTLNELNIEADVTACACTHCAVQLRACFESAQYEPDGDAKRDESCRKIVECGWANHCAGGDCYCGQGVGRVPCLEQGNAGHPQGPCAKLIEALSDCTDSDKPGNCVFTNQQTADTVLSRATDVALCVTGDPLLRSTIVPQCPLPAPGD